MNAWMGQAARRFPTRRVRPAHFCRGYSMSYDPGRLESETPSRGDVPGSGQEPNSGSDRAEPRGGAAGAVSVPAVLEGLPDYELRHRAVNAWRRTSELIDAIGQFDRYAIVAVPRAIIGQDLTPDNKNLFWWGQPDKQRELHIIWTIVKCINELCMIGVNSPSFAILPANDPLNSICPDSFFTLFDRVSDWREEILRGLAEVIERSPPCNDPLISRVIRHRDQAAIDEASGKLDQLHCEMLIFLDFLVLNPRYALSPPGDATMIAAEPSGYEPTAADPQSTRSREKRGAKALTEKDLEKASRDSLSDHLEPTPTTQHPVSTPPPGPANVAGGLPSEAPVTATGSEQDREADVGTMIAGPLAPAQDGGAATAEPPGQPGIEPKTNNAPLPDDGAVIGPCVILEASFKDHILVWTGQQWKKKRINITKYKVINALLDAGEDGLTIGQLQSLSGDARGVLRRMRENPDWEAVVLMSGTEHYGYRILHQMRPPAPTKHTPSPTNSTPPTT